MVTFALKNDGSVNAVSDSHQTGTDIYWSDRLRKWVVVSHDKQTVETADRLVAYASPADGDETGLNEACIACDFDGPEGIWVLSCDLGDEADNWEDARVIWDSAAE